MHRCYKETKCVFAPPWKIFMKNFVLALGSDIKTIDSTVKSKSILLLFFQGYSGRRNIFWNITVTKMHNCNQSISLKGKMEIKGSWLPCLNFSVFIQNGHLVEKVTTEVLIVHQYIHGPGHSCPDNKVLNFLAIKFKGKILSLSLREK